MCTALDCSEQYACHSLAIATCTAVCVCINHDMSMWTLLRRLQFVQPSFPAPPLTLDNVLNVVKNVRDWRPLCTAMLGYDIHSQHDSDEDCLKDVVEHFLRGGNYKYKNPSWRVVIWCLYEANEIQLAEQIRSYAEGVQGTVIMVLTM